MCFLWQGRQHGQLITAGENSDPERVPRHVPGPGWGEWPWESPPRVHPSPASCQWGPSQYKLSYGLALEWENLIFRNQFPLNETDPLTTWCGKDRGKVPTWGWQKESYGLQVSLRTFPPNWVDGKPWRWHHLPLFCTHQKSAFRGMSTAWKHLGSHSVTHRKGTMSQQDLTSGQGHTAWKNKTVMITPH